MTRHKPEKEVELHRESDAYVVLFDMEAFDPADVAVHWRDRRLHVSAEHGEDGDRQRVYHRSMGVPKTIDEADIEATFRDGVLEVRLPISDQEDAGRRIEVRQ
jgi:HSP20 family protein